MKRFAARLLVLLTAAGLFHARAADWPRFLGPHGDGTSPETGLVDSIPDGGLPVLWKKEIGTGYSAPSIRAGQLVLFHRLGNEEIIEAMSASQGASGWRHAYPTAYVDPYGYNNGPR
ncbi:MAG TPA: hypothetical protein DCY13_03490, partial [Verrucomicrobiales bacterium]|nr:hypothetical protein [Verrucomicrobiales bacterium]